MHFFRCFLFVSTRNYALSSRHIVCCCVSAQSIGASLNENKMGTRMGCDLSHRKPKAYNLRLRCAVGTQIHTKSTQPNGIFMKRKKQKYAFFHNEELDTSRSTESVNNNVCRISRDEKKRKEIEEEKYLDLNLFCFFSPSLLSCDHVAGIYRGRRRRGKMCYKHLGNYNKMRMIFVYVFCGRDTSEQKKMLN